VNRSRIPFQNSLLNWSCTVVEVERKGRGGVWVDLYISPTGPVERKALLDSLKDLV
jgi:hypothetical protein